MSSKLVCPHCGAEINSRIGTKVEEYGYSEMDGTYWGQEYGDTVSHFCYECGKDLPQDIVDKFFEKGENNG